MSWSNDESDDSSSQPGFGKRNHSVIESWRQQSGQLKATGCVYVLLLTECHHAIPGDADPEVIGVFDTKSAAVARASTVETEYGDFDYAISNVFENPGEYQDNRENPPDNGTLLQVGDDDIGEGDFSRLSIKKMPILSLGVEESKVEKEEEKKRKRTS